MITNENYIVRFSLSKTLVNDQTRFDSNIKLQSDRFLIPEKKMKKIV